MNGKQLMLRQMTYVADMTLTIRIFRMTMTWKSEH